MNIGNWFDSEFKGAWLDLVHTVEGQLPDEAKALAAKATADVAAATSASTTAQDSLQAAADAVLNPVVSQAVAGLKDVPVIGGVISDPSTATAVTDLAVNGLIAELEKLLTHPAPAA